MVVDSEQPDGGQLPPHVGDRLRAAREAAGLDLNDIGTRTRIPIRHLEAIERGEFGTLPSPTYAIGFVKSYARALALDEAAFARDVRVELGRAEPTGRDTPFTELTDPARVPSRLLAITALLIVILAAAGYFAWRHQYLGGSEPVVTNAIQLRPAPPVAVAPDPGDAASNPSVAPAIRTATPLAERSSKGDVALTAALPVWVRITDRDATLFEKEMAPGDRYVVPRGAADPRILTGRPDALNVTIDGRAVAPLGPRNRTVVKLRISAAALAARPSATLPVATSPARVTQ